MTNVVSLDDHVSKAWDAWVAAKRLAKESGRQDHEREAEHCWAKFVSLQMPTELRQTCMRLLTGISR